MLQINEKHLMQIREYIVPKKDVPRMVPRSLWMKEHKPKKLYLYEDSVTGVLIAMTGAQKKELLSQ